ncbi:hypothetical protein RJT34_28763 [Clitoria ternatea]|uniref:Uncharacterized protein n=1 Tax=Clitoria ternatea TaxID=43366 RepID=A0AAN9FBE0_CLITE
MANQMMVQRRSTPANRREENQQASEIGRSVVEGCVAVTCCIPCTVFGVVVGLPVKLALKILHSTKKRLRKKRQETIEAPPGYRQDSLDIERPTQDGLQAGSTSSFLAKKQKSMAKLAAALSVEEWQRTLGKAKTPSSGSASPSIEEEFSQDMLQDNEDMCYGMYE